MKARTLLAAALAIGTCLSALAADAPKPGQQPEVFEKQVQVKLDYLLYLPADYGKDAGKKWPLIVFLHGSGESANVAPGIQSVAKNAIPKTLAKGTDMKLKDFVVVSPQCPSNRQGWQPYMLNPFLDEVLAKYSVDADRVYLAGLSMGGYGTWTWAMANPERFAAIAPCCGGGNSNPRMVARSLSHMPIWNFHGEKDPTVPIAESEAMIEAVKKAGNTDVKFTRYPEAGHDSWTQAFSTAELYDWMLSHKRQPMPQGGRRGR